MSHSQKNGPLAAFGIEAKMRAWRSLCAVSRSRTTLSVRWQGAESKRAWCAKLWLRLNSENAFVWGAMFCSKRVSDEGREYLVRVFVDVDRSPAEVVTAYKTSKILKYWRTNR